jgi:polygalacturonase
VPCENIYIHNNTVYHAHGGIVIGSEMSRGVRNVNAFDNTFIGTDVGLRFKSAMGRGGVVEDIHFDNIVMSDITGEAIIFDLGYSLEKMKSELKDNDTFESNDDIPYFKNITISNSQVGSCNTFLKINGINPDTVSNIHIENVSFEANKRFDLNNCQNIEVVNTIDLLRGEYINETFNN